MGWSGPMTHRQFQVWEAWLEVQLEFPEKSDFYLMQIACEAVRSRIKNPKVVTPEDMRLKFKERELQSTQSKEQEQNTIAKAALSKWVSTTGYKIDKGKLVKVGKNEPVVETPDTSQPLPPIPRRKGLPSRSNKLPKGRNLS